MTKYENSMGERMKLYEHIVTLYDKVNLTRAKSTRKFSFATKERRIAVALHTHKFTSIWNKLLMIYQTLGKFCKSRSEIFLAKFLILKKLPCTILS